MNKLFLPSVDFVKERKNYIVGTGRFALLQFTTMLQEDIYISGFCSFDKSVVGMEIMNRSVISIEDVVSEKNANFIIAEDDYEVCEKKLKSLGVENTWVDIRMYSIINDCIWNFM